MDYSKATLIIPTLNERENLPILLDYVFSSYPGIKVIVADDGSLDGTRELVTSAAKKNKHLSLIDRSQREVKGLTASVVEGLLAAKSELAVVIDGDLQHPPEKIKEMVSALQDNELVVGTRRRVLSKWPIHRKLISKLATIMARLRLRRRIQDPVSGFFGIRTMTFKGIYAKSHRHFMLEGYKLLFDILKYLPADARIGQVMYDFGSRNAGSSKIKNKHIILFFKSLFE